MLTEQRVLGVSLGIRRQVGPLVLPLHQLRQLVVVQPAVIRSGSPGVEDVPIAAHLSGGTGLVVSRSAPGFALLGGDEVPAEQRVEVAHLLALGNVDDDRCGGPRVPQRMMVMFEVEAGFGRGAGQRVGVQLVHRPGQAH